MTFHPSSARLITIMKNTEFIQLTEMWQDGLYNKVGDVINNENWSRSRVAEFCFYFNKYVGVAQFQLLHKFI